MGWLMEKFKFFDRKIGHGENACFNDGGCHGGSYVRKRIYKNNDQGQADGCHGDMYPRINIGFAANQKKLHTKSIRADKENRDEQES